MKRLLVALVLLVIAAPAWSAVTDNIVNLYEAIPETWTGSHYPIMKKDGRWMSDDESDTAPAVLVDEKNWYLQVKDNGTGGGNTEHTCARFGSTSSGVIVAFSSKNFAGTHYVYSHSFLRYLNGKWTDISYEIAPDIEFSDFQDKSYLPDALMSYALSDMVAYEYVLPRYGTDVAVKADASGISVWLSMHEDEISAGDKKLFQKFKASFTGSELTLNWNKTAGKFEKGARKKAVK